MAVFQNKNNETNKGNPVVDTGLTTVNAYNVLKKKQEEQEDYHLALEKNKDTGKNYKNKWKYSHKNMNRKIHIKAWTQDDNQYHTYFHSLSIDVQVTDFMGTAELACPYDSDLMEYWEPIRQTVVIYGDNGGQYKDSKDILFVGRVRELRQDGYELVITFQNYGWKFKQNVTTSYANDNVLNKNGYAIMCAMFEALKIDSYVISASAEKRLREVGIDSDGNLKANGEEIEEVPDLLERLKDSNPSDYINKETLTNYYKEDKLANIENINYTLQYEEPTEAMKSITSNSGGYTPTGSGVYGTQWGSASGSSSSTGTSGSSSSSSSGTSCTPPNAPCASIKEEYLQATAREMWKYQRNCPNNYNTYIARWDALASQNPTKWKQQVSPCISTLSKVNTRTADAKWKQQRDNSLTSKISNAISTASKAVTKTIKSVGSAVASGINTVGCNFCKLRYGKKYTGPGDSICNRYRYQNGKGYFKC